MDTTRHDNPTTELPHTEATPQIEEPFGSARRSRIAALAVAVGLTFATGAVAAANLGGSDPGESTTPRQVESAQATADDAGDGQDADTDPGAETAGDPDSSQSADPESSNEPTPADPAPADPAHPADPDPSDPDPGPGNGNGLDGLTIDTVIPGLTIPESVLDDDDDPKIEIIKPGLIVPSLSHDDAVPIGSYGTGALILTNTSNSPVSWTVVDSHPDLEFTKPGLDGFVKTGLSGVVPAGGNGAIIVAFVPELLTTEGWSRTFVVSHGGTQHEITVHDSP